jgi:cholesterol transport system auxiliary component
MIDRRALLAGAFAAGSLALSGCSGIGGAAPLDTFDFSAPVPAAKGAAGRSLQVLVADPVADRSLDTDRIVVRSGDNEIALYAGAQWADRLPRLVQSRLVAALDASGRVRAAARPGQGMAADRQVLTEIRAFEYRPAERRVVVTLAIKAMDDRSGRILAAAVLSGDEPVSGDVAAAVTGSFDRLLARLLGEAVGLASR